MAFHHKDYERSKKQLYVETKVLNFDHNFNYIKMKLNLLDKTVSYKPFWGKDANVLKKQFINL